MFVLVLTGCSLQTSADPRPLAAAVTSALMVIETRVSRRKKSDRPSDRQRWRRRGRVMKRRETDGCRRRAGD